MWILAEAPGEVINLNYVSRIYMEYATKNSERHKLLAEYKDSIICLVSYDTKEELQEAVERLGAEMARTGIGIEIRENKEQIRNPIKLAPITIELAPIFDSLTPENRMIVTKRLLTSMADEELKTFIEFCQSQISTAEPKR